MSRVAVVIPLFNHARFIEATLDSVRRQTRPADRLLVIDDGSTDGSAEVVEKLAIPGLELIRQENQGAHAALNRGIATAEDCDWIALLNSDDLFAAARLERCLAVLAQRPKTELLCTRLHLIDREGRALPPDSAKVRRLERISELVLAEPDPLISLGISNYAKTTSNFVASRRFLLAHPFAAYRYVHDYHTMLRAALAGKLSILPEDLLAYRLHGSNTIKASGKSAVVTETLQMILDWLAGNAATLRESPEMRKRHRLFFQRLLGNHTDFRGELFLQLLAEALAADRTAFPVETLAGFAEMTGPSSPLPR